MDVKRIVIVTIVCLAVTVGLLLFVHASHAATTLMAHAGAGIRPPLDELGKAFEKKTGIRVEFNYKGSGCLLADICFSRRGDIYIPGEVFYVKQARERGLVKTDRVVAQMSTVLIVQKGNPKKIRSLKDLSKSGVRVGLGEPDAVAAGRAADAVLDRAGLLKAVEKNVAMRALNVVELGNAVKLRHLDAAIVWDATATLFGSDVVTLPIPEDYRVVSPIPVGVLNFSKHSRQAEQFMRYLATPEAAKVFLKHGYSAPEGAAKTPEKGSTG